ncbi:MAG TPA: HAD family hydrolase [Nitrososphaerales archaeon]|nr:HAD family hydrolase [Nitrososphaerales archaeon]
MVVAAIFDIDGTLVSFKFDAVGVRTALIGELRVRGVDTSGLDLSSPTQKILDTAKARMVPGDGGYGDYRRKVFGILDTFELRDIASTKAFLGTRDVLADLKAKGVRLAVLTNSGRKAATKSITIAGLLGLFEFVLTRDDTETMKPRPEGILQAVSMLSLPKDDVYYIGDTPYDVMAAKSAGVRSVSVTTGSYASDRLASEGADYVISSISELGNLLGIPSR